MLMKFIVSLITYVFYVIIKTQKQLYILKNAKYKNEKYLEDIKNIKNVWLEPILLSLILFIFIFYHNSIICMVTFILIYMISALFLLQQNKKIKKTLDNKDKKILFANILGYLLIMVLFISIYVEEYMTMYFLVLFFIAYMSPIWILLDNIVLTKLKPSRKKKK